MPIAVANFNGASHTKAKKRPLNIGTSAFTLATFDFALLPPVPYDKNN